MKINIAGLWKDATPKKIKVGAAWRDVKSTKVNVGGVWKETPGGGHPPGVAGLYDCAIVYQGNKVVDFTAITTITHTNGEEAYMFRCTEAEKLNGYVGKTFTKTFPTTGYARFNCTLQDMSGDILAADAKTISFTVDNK